MHEQWQTRMKKFCNLQLYISAALQYFREKIQSFRENVIPLTSILPVKRITGRYETERISRRTEMCNVTNSNTWRGERNDSPLHDCLPRGHYKLFPLRNGTRGTISSRVRQKFDRPMKFIPFSFRGTKPPPRVMTSVLRLFQRTMRGMPQNPK